MASSGDEGRVVVDLRSAAESTAAAPGAGGEEAHATPLHEIESLCMRCEKNVSAPVACLLLFICSITGAEKLCLAVWPGYHEAPAYADPAFPRGTCFARGLSYLLVQIVD
jgi:hypothetical protein